jgi:hypothetical protein
MSHYLSEDMFTNVSRGLVKNASIRNLFGYNAAISTTYIPAWENATPYVYPPDPLIMTVTSATADASATIRIIGLDENYDIISEDVSLDASGSTVTSKAFFRINDVITVGNGSIINGNPASDVTISAGGVTYAKVRGGDGRNQASIFTVPRGHSFYLYRIDAFCATAVQNNRELFFRNFVKSSAGVTLRVAESSFRDVLNIQRRFPLRYEEKTDIQFQLKASGGIQFMSVFGEGIVVKE